MSNAAKPLAPKAPTPATPTMPVVPPIPDPTPADSVVVIAGLADTAGHTATALHDYRCDNPAASDIAQAQLLENQLNQRADDLRTQAIALLGAQAADALAQMADATKKVDAFLLGVKAVAARLELATAIVTLAGAALSEDAGGILSAALGVHSALKAEQALT